MDENEFREKASSEGYSEPELHDVAPMPVKEMHTHDLTIMSLVLRGEFTMFHDHRRYRYRRQEYDRFDD